MQHLRGLDARKLVPRQDPVVGQMVHRELDAASLVPLSKDAGVVGKKGTLERIARNS